jgi:hypothetical protein
LSRRANAAIEDRKRVRLKLEDVRYAAARFECVITCEMIRAVITKGVQIADVATWRSEHSKGQQKLRGVSARTLAQLRGVKAQFIVRVMDRTEIICIVSFR